MTLSNELASQIESGIFGIETPLDEIDLRLDHYFSGDEARARVSLMNLAVFNTEAEQLLADDEALREIARNQACRALLMNAGCDSWDAPVRCWLNTRCTLGSGGDQWFCSEQLTFLMGAESGDRHLTNLVFSHLLSDLPLVMWWRGEFADFFDPELYSRIDRLIVDSSRYEDTSREFRLIGEAFESGDSHLALSSRKSHFSFHDLAYTRGHQHRRAIAAAFDDPGALSYLQSLTDVTIRFGPGHRNSALYLTAWIARQLGASLQCVSGGGFEYAGPGGRLSFHLSADEGDSSPLSEVLLCGPEAKFEIAPACDYRFLSVRSSHGSTDSEFTVAGPMRKDSHLVNAILMRGSDNLLLPRVIPGFLGLVS